MIPLYPVHIDAELNMLVVTTEVPVLGGLFVKRARYAWAGMWWVELPLPWYRRYAVAW